MGASLAPYTTLKAGGPAERLMICRTAGELKSAAEELQQRGERGLILGSGSNVLPSDAGVPGLTIINLASEIRIAPDGLIEADSGACFQDVFLKSAQAGLGGLEFAVGIPGTLGGALASNAGAYRSSTQEFLVEIEATIAGKTAWHPPAILELSYRDSILRKAGGPFIVVSRIRLRLPKRDRKAIYDEARNYQRQRIGKQPPPASAGSFFKNVIDHELARQLPGLTDSMREAGVVPAGHLIEQCGLKGTRFLGAMVGQKHANFMLNVGGAKASSIRRLAEHVKAKVRSRFGVELEEEVLFLGDWSDPEWRQPI